MRAFVYGEWWSGRNFSTDNEATMPPNLDRPIKKARMGVDSKLYEPSPLASSMQRSVE